MSASIHKQIILQADTGKNKYPVSKLTKVKMTGGIAQVV
jgi:hypothetical protein